METIQSLKCCVLNKTQEDRMAIIATKYTDKTHIKTNCIGLSAEGSLATVHCLSNLCLFFHKFLACLSVD
jgi:hypothetical protein